MKAIAISFLSVLCLAAQPAPKTPSKTGAPSKTGTAAHRGKPLMLNPAAYKAVAPAVYRARFTTTKGDFVVEVTRAWAPLGADRFYNLVKGGYYDGAPIFRVIDGFMAQMGISASPAVNKAWEHAVIKDDRVTQSNKRGNITFATAGPGTRTTQVFINYKDNAGLDSQGFAPFGTVIEGMNVVDSFFKGYGESPDQEKLNSEGIAYVKKSFPNLDVITSAVIVPAATPSTSAPPPGTSK